MQVLRIAADHRIRMHHDVVAENRIAAHHCAGLQVAVIAELRVVFDDRGGMNGGSQGFYSGKVLAVSGLRPA